MERKNRKSKELENKGPERQRMLEGSEKSRPGKEEERLDNTIIEISLKNEQENTLQIQKMMTEADNDVLQRDHIAEMINHVKEPN